MTGAGPKNIGVQKKRWVVCFDSGILDLDLSVYEKMVYIALCAHARKDGPCYPSVKKIAFEASCSRAKVFEALNVLEARGIISRSSQIFGGRGQTSNLYEILDIPVGTSPESGNNGNPPTQSTMETGCPQDGRGASIVETGASAKRTGGVHGADTPLDELEQYHLNQTKEQKSPPTPQGEREGKITRFDESETPKPQRQKHDTEEKEENIRIPKPPEPVSRGSGPYEKILEAYNRILPELTRAEKLTGSRSKTLALRIAEDSARKDIRWWEEYFARVRNYPWLMGNNPNGWKAAFDWLTGEDGMRKVIEGAFTQAPRREQSHEEMLEWQRRYTDERGIVDAKALLRDWRASVAGAACSGRC
jgi:hypothetical protein